MRNKTILLVDDDALARIGICSIANFESHGYVLVAEADNGTKAFQLAMQYQPDIILSDIKMPGLDGVELLLKCRDAKLKSRFIMLSSHDDFAFVQKALTNGASDYILKYQLTAEKLFAALDHALVGAPLEDGTGCNVSDDGIIRDLLLCRDTLSPAEQAILSEGIGIDRGLYCAIIVKMLSDSNKVFTESELHRLERPQCNLCQEIAHAIPRCKVFFLGGRTHVFFLPFDYEMTKGEQTAHEIGSFTSKVVQMYRFVLNAKPVFGVSSIAASPLFFRKCFQESEEAVRSALVQNLPLCHYAHRSKTPDSSADVNATLEELKNGLGNLSGKAISDAFASLKGQVEDPTRFVAVGQTNGLAYMILFIVRPYLTWVGSDEDMSLIEHDISLLCSKEDFIIWLDKLQDTITGKLSDVVGQSQVIMKAKAYIDANFRHPITLETVALEVKLSPSYFSKQFYQVTGEKFIDYVTDVRIQEAQRLLRTTTERVFSISTMVGYANNTYFNYLFRKKTGMSPQEYRQK